MKVLIDFLKAIGLVTAACVIWLAIPVLWILLVTIGAIVVTFIGVREIREEKENESGD